MIEMSTNAGSLAVRYSHASRLVASSLFRALQEIGARLQRIVVTEKLASGGILEPRTGNAKRSIFSRVEIEQDGLSALARVGANLSIAKYMRIQELGGVITAKNAAHLTIPLDAAKTAKGVARFSARDVIGNPQSFGFWGTFTAKRVIFGRTRDRGVSPTPLFVLKRSVTLPARQPLRSTLQRETPWILTRIGGAATEAADAIGGGAGEAS